MDGGEFGAQFLLLEPSWERKPGSTRQAGNQIMMSNRADPKLAAGHAQLPAFAMLKTFLGN